jgi:TM2 domain-containing membrane protein YozV/RNA polymerase subunit RPABC4/transcription elongation factor Spt4
MSQTTNQPVPYRPLASKQADQKFCYGCGTVIHISAADCPACGARQTDYAVRTNSGVSTVTLPSGQVFCRGCGHALHQSAPLCPHCGAPQDGLSSVWRRPLKSKVLAALLAFFLGGFGVHKFYLGEIGLGILYLLFCWTFIPALIAIIEAIVYLAMSEEQFARKYG